jgi:NAD+ kinase
MSAERTSEIAGDDERERAKREICAMKTAALITHSHPPAATEAVAVAVAVAREAGWRLVATAEELAKHGAAAEGVEEVAEPPARPDLCLVLGGDGSILHALRRFARSGVPVFGVNFGTVGFLAAVEREDAEEGIRRALRGETEAVQLPGLEVAIGGEPRVAFNDVTFARRPQDRVAELSYKIDGEEVGHVRCDGLVAATPAGSTGYNLANQGPILAWGVEGYVVSYIAPHSLTARALVVAPGDVLNVGNATGREPVDVAVDGELVGELAPGAALEVRFANGVGLLAQLPGTSFYQRIREKFGHLAV